MRTLCFLSLVMSGSLLIDENASQTLQIFLDCKGIEQETVQNGFIWMQFEYNLKSSFGLLEYLFLTLNMHLDWFFLSFSGT